MCNLTLLKPYHQHYKNLEPVHLSPPDPQVVSCWRTGPGNSVNPKVLLLDIDETMIHCIDDRDPPQMRGESRLRIDLDRQDGSPEFIDIDINVRPGLRECLLDLKRSYQIVSFTASDKLYADTILDFLDPEDVIFSHRLYRHHCVETEFGLIKDLRIITNRSLKDMVIIDNSALSFTLNVNNGIPILPFYDCKSDEELKHLAFYLNCLQDSKVEDIRVHNEEAFGLLRLGFSGGLNPVKHRQEGFIDEGTPHNMSKDYQRCDPVEIDESSQNLESAWKRNHISPTSAVNVLSLMNTNTIIEERSNEDGGLSSHQLSPDLPKHLSGHSSARTLHQEQGLGTVTTKTSKNSDPQEPRNETSGSISEDKGKPSIL